MEFLKTDNNYNTSIVYKPTVGFIKVFSLKAACARVISTHLTFFVCKILMSYIVGPTSNR